MTKPLPYPQRIARLRASMQALDLDAFLVLIEANRRYLSGYSAEDGQFDETAGALIIAAKRMLLITDSRYELQARQEADGFEVVCQRDGLLDELAGRFVELGLRNGHRRDPAGGYCDE